MALPNALRDHVLASMAPPSDADVAAMVAAYRGTVTRGACKVAYGARKPRTGMSGAPTANPEMYAARRDVLCRAAASQPRR